MLLFVSTFQSIDPVVQFHAPLPSSPASLTSYSQVSLCRWCESLTWRVSRGLDHRDKAKRQCLVPFSWGNKLATNIFKSFSYLGSSAIVLTLFKGFMEISTCPNVTEYMRGPGRCYGNTGGRYFKKLIKSLFVPPTPLRVGISCDSEQVYKILSNFALGRCF